MHKHLCALATLIGIVMLVPPLLTIGLVDAAVVGGGPAAAVLRRGPVDDILEPIRARRHLPALAAVVVRGDGSITVGAVGVRRRFDSTVVTAADRRHLGSNGKAFTATLVVRLLEDGRLDWSTTVEEVFPELRSRFDPSYRRVTTEMLLAHCAGLPHDFRVNAAWMRAVRRRGLIQRQRLDLVFGGADRGRWGAVGDCRGIRYTSRHTRSSGCAK